MDWAKCSASSAACSSRRRRTDFQRAADLLVQADAARREDLLVEGLAEEGVAEAEGDRAAGLALLDHARARVASSSAA